MPEKIAVLLADSDALRRDGMAAVVQEGGTFEVISRCADGLSAIDEIRAVGPEIAVIDLNLPKLHGIEVIRQVRSEQLHTKVIVISGTDDDAIIREVVRVGGDGFLLKNGPARHLLDAIQYVRDGGQYFSPHLRRDGLDRNLLEERPPISNRDEVPSRTKSASRAPMKERLRERLEEDPSQHLAERDYEILSMMAEGIRPILDRLDDIEGRVNGMETGLEPIPANPKGWLSTQFADTIRNGGPRPMAVQPLGSTLREMEARLPQLIEETVNQRFQSMAGKLQREIEESHIKTLESFVKNIQVKLVSRVSALEKDMALQAENMHQLRESSQRTEENLSRLISGVDKLAQDLPRRLQNPSNSSSSETDDEPADYKSSRTGNSPRPEQLERTVRRVPSHPHHSDEMTKKIVWWGIAAVAFIVVAFWVATSLIPKRGYTTSPSQAPNAASNDAGTRSSGPGAGADTKSKMDAAEDYARRKDYVMAEELYRQVVKAEPRNTDALKALASVLYRQDKIDESAEILNKVPAQ